MSAPVCFYLLLFFNVKYSFFRSVLGSQHSWGGGMETFHTLPALPHGHSLPITNTPHQSGTFATVGDPVLTNHYHPKSIVPLGSVLLLTIQWVLTNVKLY